MVYVIVFLVISSLLIGLYKSIHLQLIIELNTLSTPYYNVGISFYSEEDDEDSSIVIEKVCIGLFFINLIIIFYKKNI
jgi:hypothetical protein